MPITRHRAAVCLLACLLLLGTAVAEAQVIQPPRRVFRPAPVSDRLQQNLTLEMDLLGGIDDNLSPQSAQTFVPQPAAYSGYAATRMRYRVGRPARSFEARGGGFVNSYRNVGRTPSYGGDVEFQGRTEVGRRMGLDVTQRVRSSPYFVLGSFDTLQPTVADSIALDNGALDSGSTQSLAEIRSLAFDTRASLRQDWTQRTSTAFSYRYSDLNYESDLVFDSRRHLGEFTYDRSVGRYSGIEASYRYSDFEAFGVDTAAPDRLVNLPIKDQTLDVGFRYGRDVSRTRRLEVAAGVGPVFTETVDRATLQPREFWAGSGYGRASIDVGRTWTFDADYRRSVSVLQGVVPEAFLTDAASVSLGGLLGDRIETVFSGRFSNGATGGVGVTGEVGRFDAYTVSGQLGVRVTDWSSALVNYSHYRHTLNTIASQTLGAPPELDRNSVYVGVSLRVPMVGASFVE